MLKNYKSPVLHVTFIRSEDPAFVPMAVSIPPYESASFLSNVPIYLRIISSLIWYAMLALNPNTLRRSCLYYIYGSLSLRTIG